MQCPKCSVEMRVNESGYVANEGKVFLKQVFTCRNSNCSNYQKEVKAIYMPLEISEDPAATDEISENIAEETPEVITEEVSEDSEETDEVTAP